MGYYSIKQDVMELPTSASPTELPPPHSPPGAEKTSPLQVDKSKMEKLEDGTNKSDEIADEK